jgi:hypothetical protein
VRIPIVVLVTLTLSHVAFAGLAEAAGAIYLSWDQPYVPGQPRVDSRTYAGPGVYDLYATLAGQDEPLSALQVWLVVDTQCGSGLALPDAWHFEDGGCQSGQACFVAGSFLSLVPPPQRPQYDWIADWSHDPLSDQSRVVVAEAYRAFVVPPGAAVPVVRWRLDMREACSGGDIPVILRISRASYLNAQGFEIPYSLPGESVGWNQPSLVHICDPLARKGAVAGADTFAALLSGNFGHEHGSVPRCDLAVPAAATSWGRLKSSYR